MTEPLFISPFFLDFILPFVLVFTLIFAILQKTKLLGEEVKQINAIIGLTVGLMLIAFPPARALIVLLMPFLAVVAVILLVFMLLYGFATGAKDGNIVGDWWKVAFGFIISVALVSYFLVISGYWDFVWNLLFQGGGGVIFTTILMAIVIIGAIVAVVRG